MDIDSRGMDFDNAGMNFDNPGMENSIINTKDRHV